MRSQVPNSSPGDRWGISGIILTLVFFGRAFSPVLGVNEGIMMNFGVKSRKKLRSALAWIFPLVGALSQVGALEAHALPAGGWDYSAGFGARSLPFGAAFNVQGGWNQTLWGDAKDGGALGYGLIRPAARVQTSGLTSSGEARVGLYPIPILGVNAGVTASYRNISALHTLSCETFECSGLLTGRYIQPRAVIGYGSVFLTASYRIHQITDQVGERPFAEENSTLAGSLGGDTLNSLELIAGYRASDQDQLLALWTRQKMQESLTENQFFMFAVRHQFEGSLWSMIAGAGAYESSTQRWGPAFALVTQWTPVLSWELF